MSQKKSTLGARFRHLMGGLRKRAFYLLWEPNYLPNGYQIEAVAPRAMVTSPNHLSRMAGIKILLQGGNAVDAAAAVGLADTVVNPHQHTLGGEITLLIYLAREQRVVVVNGDTIAPRKATINYYREQGLENIPWDGLQSAGVPAALDGWITALDRCGTLSFSQVAQPAIDLAEKGYPLLQSLHALLVRRRERFTREWPSSGRVYLHGGEAPPIGSLMTNRELSSLLKSLAEMERQTIRGGGSRSGALKAVRDRFYRGDIAEAIARFSEANGALLSKDDLESFTAEVEEPLSIDYRGYQIYKAGPWTQGAVLLQALNLLEGYDLKSMGHNSHRFVHTVLEAEKLAFADREQYYADPRFVEVPMEQLLSREYASARRKLIDSDRASMDHRPGDPYRQAALLAREGEWARPPLPVRVGSMAQGIARGDTVHFDVVDPEGNMVSATSSGAMIQYSPIVEGLGFALGTRLQMFYLDPRHPNALVPGKRPRTTVSPTLVLLDGRPFVSLGSPGGDTQEQVTLQALIRMIDFGMPVAKAMELPFFLTRHFPSSFNPHSAVPGSLILEGRIPATEEWKLRRMGHDVTVKDWTETGLLGIQIDPNSGVRTAGADPRPVILGRLEVGGSGF